MSEPEVTTTFRPEVILLDIDPTVDYACKMLLGNPAHSRLTIHFLNAVIKPKSPIVAVQYLNPILQQEFETDKLAILDILAQDELGRRFNIEVQRTSPRWLPERLTYYAAAQLVEQIGEGENYDRLCPSIGICILKAKLFPSLPEYHHEFRLRAKTGFELTNCLEIHLLELPKYPKWSDNRRLEDPLDQWMDFFQNAEGSSSEEMRRRLDSPVFDEAIEVLEMILKTAEQRRLYYARLILELDENTRRKDEEAARAQTDALRAEAEALQADAEALRAQAEALGKAEGLAVGKAEGLAVGKAEGLAVGKAEAKAEQIQMLQEILGEPQTEIELLLRMSLAEMDGILAELRGKLQGRLA